MPNAMRVGVAGASTYLSRVAALPPMSAMSILLWAKPAAWYYGYEGFASIFKLTGGTVDYTLYRTPAGLFDIANGAVHATGSSLSPGRYYHMAMTSSDTTGANLLG
jgi:hypothetical protein